MSLLKSVVALAAFFPLVVLAQGAEVKKEEAKTPEKKITPYGVLDGNINMFDTSSPIMMDEFTSYMRLGFKVDYGIAKGQLETGYTANILERNTGKNTGSNTVGVRAANVGIDFPTKTAFRLGRIRPGYASLWGADGTGALAPAGFAAVDGLRITQSLDLPENGSINVGAAYAMSLRGDAAVGTGLKMGDYPMGGGDADTGYWKKNDKAIILNMGVSIMGVSAVVYYGMENNAYLNKTVEYTQGIPTSDPANLDSQAITKINIGKVQHLEASLGYDADHFGLGAWYQQITKGEGKLSQVTNGKLEATGAVLTKTMTDSWVGVGASGDSVPMGMSDLLQTGDKLIAGISYEKHWLRDENLTATAKTELAKTDLNFISASVGYDAGGGFSTSLGATYAMTDAKTFADSKGVAGKNTNQTIVNLRTIWGF